LNLDIKHDGYRLMARRDGAGLRLLTRNGMTGATAYCSSSKRWRRLRLNKHFEHSGEVVYRYACKMGLEGIVSKRKDHTADGQTAMTTPACRCQT
jgi:ATP-dependent DNA ligase